MSLLNRNFLTPDGTPITGRTPTQIIVHGSGPLSDQQRAMVEHAYKLFCDNVRLSPAASGYHVQNRQLPDGTRVRMEANGGLDRVMVWPGGGDEEDVSTFYGIPYDESYIDAPTGAPGELAKEAVFFVDKMRLNGGSPTSILNRLKLADQHLMYPSLIDATKLKPSQPGNSTWFAKGKKKVPVLSWWGQYSRYSNAPTQRSKWGNKVWGRSLLVNSVFWEDELTAGLQKYPPLYNADRIYGGDYTFASPVTGSANANDVRDYVWVSGQRVKTGVYDALGLYILSACIGIGSGGKVVRLTLGIHYPTVVAEIGLAVFLQAAKDKRDFVFSSEFSTYTITPSLPEALGITSHPNWINWQLQPPYWNSSGNEAMGLIDHYVISGVSNVAHSLYKISYDADSHVFSAALVEQSAANESWTNTDNRAVSGSLAAGTLFQHIGSKTVADTKNFSSSISASRVIAADYDGDTPVIVRMEYAETMSKVETLTLSQTGSESQSASVDLYANAICTAHGTPVNYLYKTAPGVWSGSRNFSKTYGLAQRITQVSRLKANTNVLIERNRNYANDVSGSVSLVGNGSGTLAASTIAYTNATSVDHGSGLEPATGIDRQMGTYTYGYNETHSRNLTFSETSTGSCTDFSIVGDLRAGAFVVHERSIAPGMFSVGTPGDAMNVALLLGESWNSLREGSAWTVLSDSATVSYTDTSSNSNNAALHDWSSTHNLSGSWAHSANGGMNYAIPEFDGQISLVCGSKITPIGAASLKGISGSIERRKSFVPYTPFTSSHSGTVSTGPYSTPDIYLGNGSVFGQTTTAEPALFGSGVVVPTKGTYGYTYDNATVSNSVFSPPTTNLQPDKINQFFVSIASLTSSGPTTTSGGGVSNFRFGSNGFDNSDGPGGYPYYSVASSAAAKNGRIAYIGYQSETLIKHDAPLIPYVVKLDIWLVDGHHVVPTKKYPHPGAYKMFSCPVFV